MDIGINKALLQAQVAAMAAQLAQQQQAAAAATPQQPEKIGHIMTPVGFLKQWGEWCNMPIGITVEGTVHEWIDCRSA